MHRCSNIEEICKHDAKCIKLDGKSMHCADRKCPAEVTNRDRGDQWPRACEKERPTEYRVPLGDD